MRKGFCILIFLVFLSVFFVGCTSNLPGEGQQLANPASVYCEKQGNTLTIIKDSAGNEYGVCKFDDGTECEEWDYFRGKCKQGDTEVAVPVDEEQCTSLGGEWGRFGLAPFDRCNLPTKDSGKVCTNGSQCDAGLCVTESPNGWNGNCPAWKLNFGCLNLLEDGKAAAWCID